MKKLFPLFLLTLVALTSNGQTTKKEKALTECVHRTNLNIQQRLKLYPFNIAPKIQLVSVLNTDTTNKRSDIPIYNIPIKKDTLCVSQVKSVITLNQDQIDKLTNLLFNIGLKGDSYTFGISTAVGLDGLILFVNSDNKIVEYIQLCFDCGEVEVKASKANKSIGLPCVEKMNLLKSFFLETGVTFSK